jgi:uncharacterized protein
MAAKPSTTDRRLVRATAPGATDGDALMEDERDYVGERDSFYLATVSETGWPYVQFRGGPPGFLRLTYCRFPRKSAHRSV